MLSVTEQRILDALDRLNSGVADLRVDVASLSTRVERLQSLEDRLESLEAEKRMRMVAAGGAGAGVAGIGVAVWEILKGLIG